MLVWIVPNGPILANEALPPDVHPVAACVDSFRATTLAPAVGRPHVPTHVRVASPAMAKALRAGLPKSIEVLCAPTPEVEELADGLRIAPTEDSVEGRSAADVPGAGDRFEGGRVLLSRGRATASGRTLERRPRRLESVLSRSRSMRSA